VDADALYTFLEDSDSQGGYLIGTDLNLSQIRWSRKADRAWSSEWPQLWNGLLLAGNCRSELDAFRISDGVPQWSDRLKGCLRSIGTDADSEQIYVGAQEGMVYAYSPALAASRDKKH
jgi:outer membrane protein assembly factor BamB